MSMNIPSRNIMHSPYELEGPYLHLRGALGLSLIDKLS